MLRLTIGNKVYSSWSMCPWLVMKEFDVPFEEEVVPLYREDSKARLLARSPSGKAPALEHDGLKIWDSLAIIDYVAELFPDRAIWPRARAARAAARALFCEIHAGFTALRQECPMNFRRAPVPLAVSEAALADIARIGASWREAFGGEGPFLFGEFCAADALLAPVAQRVRAYDLGVSAEAKQYIEAITRLESWRALEQGALAEEWAIEAYARP